MSSIQYNSDTGGPTQDIIQIQGTHKGYNSDTEGPTKDIIQIQGDPNRI